MQASPFAGSAQAPPAVTKFLELSAAQRTQPEALQQLTAILQILAQGYDPHPETRRKLVGTLLRSVRPAETPIATAPPSEPLVPLTCALLKLLGRDPAGTEELARPDGLKTLLHLGGLERVAAIPKTSSADPTTKGTTGDSHEDVDEEIDVGDAASAKRAERVLADARDDPLAPHESEALRCLANTLTLHPSARDIFPEVIFADERRGALRGLVSLLTCKGASFLAGRILFLLTSKPSDVIAELVLGGDCTESLRKFAEDYLTVFASKEHRPLLSAGPPTSTWDDILKEHLKLAYNLMLQYARAPSAVPETFGDEPNDETAAAGKKKRFWRSRSTSGGTEPQQTASASPSPSFGATLQTPDPAGAGSAAPIEPPPRSKSPVAFAKRVVGAVKRSSPSTSPKESQGDSKPNSAESSEGNSSGTLSITAAHLFLPLFRPYLSLAVTAPLSEPASPDAISPIVRSAINTLLNFPLELEELSGWSTSWLQYVPPRVSTVDGTVLQGGGIGSLGERLLEVFRAVCDQHFPADRAPPNPKTHTKQDRETGRKLEPPCQPDEWFPGVGDAAARVDEVLGPVVLLLRKLSMLGGAQFVFRELLFPPASERKVPLDKQPTTAGHLVRLMSSILLPNTAFGVGEFVYNLCDRSPEKFVQTIGYGLASGFLQNRQELIPPPPADDPAATDPTSSSPRVNPITGAVDSQAASTEPPLTDEEKEREAERLYVLFDRIARTGVMSAENPVGKAQHEGRFEETSDAREAELKRLREEDDRLEQEVERDLQRWREARDRPAVE